MTGALARHYHVLRFPGACNSTLGKIAVRVEHREALAGMEVLWDYGEIFYTLREAQIIIESWRRHYNPASQHPSFYVIEDNRSC